MIKILQNLKKKFSKQNKNNCKGFNEKSRVNYNHHGSKIFNKFVNDSFFLN